MASKTNNNYCNGESDRLKLSSPANSSEKSFDSSDSGVCELDYIITENSSPDLVNKIETDFTPVENLGIKLSSFLTI